LRLFVDSNVLVSGMVFEGNEARFLDEAWGEHELYTSADCLEEIIKVMAKKFPEYMELVENFIKTIGLNIVPRRDYTDDLDDYDRVRDKNDRHVLAAAIKAKCRYIITGDKDLLALKEEKQVDIINASRFLSLER